MSGVPKAVVPLVLAALLASGCSDDPGPPAVDAPLAGEAADETAEPEAGPAHDRVTDEAGEPADGTGPAGSEGALVTIRFVSQNLLHGIGCPAETERCRLDERVALFTSQLSETGCPEMVSIQEANEATVAALEANPAAGCDYTVVWDGDEGLDREVVLTTLDVVDIQRLGLAGRFRSALLVRAVSPAGVVDFVSTHLASSDNRDCDPENCAPPCEAGDQIRACQTRQILAWASGATVDGAITVIGGDLNAVVGRPPIDLVLAEGFVDSHLAAGRAECDGESGLNCTSGRESTSLVDMTDPESRQRRRIDYLFVDPGSSGCVVGEDSGLFNAEPAVGDLAYPSDHTGVVLVLECQPGDRPDLAGVPTLPNQPEIVDEPTTGVPDPAAAAAITGAYETFFDGSVTDLALRISQVENGERFEDMFATQVAAAGSLASETSARVESISLTSETTADVVYTILVLGGAVFDHVDGNAVRVDGRWLVGEDTFCDLARQDPSNVPEACA